MNKVTIGPVVLSMLIDDPFDAAANDTTTDSIDDLDNAIADNNDDLGDANAEETLENNEDSESENEHDNPVSEHKYDDASKTDTENSRTRCDRTIRKPALFNRNPYACE